MYVYIYICIYIYIYICVYVYIYIYICIYVSPSTQATRTCTTSDTIHIALPMVRRSVHRQLSLWEESESRQTYASGLTLLVNVKYHISYGELTTTSPTISSKQTLNSLLFVKQQKCQRGVWPETVSKIKVFVEIIVGELVNQSSYV